MLERLEIANLVVIERAEIEFAPGLTAITGETGTGKTIVAGGLDLVLGGRADAGLVGPASREAYVEATFAVRPEELADAAFDGLREVLPDGDEGLVLARRLSLDGRSRTLASGRSITRQAMADGGGRLVGVVSQHEARRLARPSISRGLVDSFAGDEARAAGRRHAGAYDALQDARRAFAATESGLAEAERRRSELERLVEELDAVAPAPGELDVLAGERERLRHAEDLARVATSARDAIAPEDGEGAAALTFGALRAVEEGASYDPALADLAAELADAAIRLEEAAHALHAYSASIEHDPQRLDSVEARMAVLESLVRRHGSLEAAIAAAAEARSSLEDLADTPAALARAHAAVEAAESAAQETADRLSTIRREHATRLGQAVEANLADLGMERASCRIEVAPRDLARHGADAVSILLAANPGVAPAPIGDVASGGELARITLALRVAAHERDGVATLVFDEIDAGIGGATATAVGRKLAQLAADTQVIVITHLAQVAAFADRHLRVVKEALGETTVTRVEALHGAESDAELARMLGGDAESVAALELARSLRAARA
jgi:DNA repair protein RecN (Recombination protein N)